MLEREQSTKPASGDTPEAILSRQLFNEYRSSKTDWDAQALRNDEFRNGVQWTKEQEKTLRARNQSPIVVNVIHPAVEQLKALLTFNKPKFQSFAREDSDVNTGRLFSDLMSYVWDYNSANVELKRVIDDYVVKGAGWMVCWNDVQADYGRGEIRLRNEDPMNVYPDPNAQDIFCRDAAHILISKIVTGEQAKATYHVEPEDLPYQENDHSNTSAPGPERQVIGPVKTDGLHKKFRVIDRYTKTTRPVWYCRDSFKNLEYVHFEEDYQEWLSGSAIVSIDQSGTHYHYDSDQFDEYGQILQQGINVFHMAIPVDPATGQPASEEPQMVPGPEDQPQPNTMPVPGSTVYLMWTKIEAAVGSQLECEQTIESAIFRHLSIGGKTVWEGLIPVTEYPVIPLFNQHNRNPYPISDVHMVRGLQEYVNKIRSLIIAHASNATNVKVFIPQGSISNKAQFERDFGKAGAAAFEYNAESGPPVIVSPQMLPNELYKNEADARNDIEQIFGVYAVEQGTGNQVSQQTFRGTIVMDEFAQRRIKSKRDDIEAFLNQVAKVVVRYIQKTWTRQKTVRIAQPNNTPREVQINQPIYHTFTNEVLRRSNNVTIGQYDVVVVSGSTLPTNRFARGEYFKELYQMGLIDQLETLKQMEVADIEGVIERFSEMMMLKRELEGATEEIKKLSGDLQTSQRETMHARQHAELASFKAKLAAEDSQNAAASQLYRQRLSDGTKMAAKAVSQESQLLKEARSLFTSKN
jgi:hypothetical protein